MSEAYFTAGQKRAEALGNRGPLTFDADGHVAPHILEAYWRLGFYVLEGVVDAAELEQLRSDFAMVQARAPTHSKSKVDASGQPALGLDIEAYRPVFQFARPLSDPMGGTDATNGRYPVKMAEHEPPVDAPAEVLLQIAGNLQLMDSCLRLYGHPQLLKVAEDINGPDFTPFTDALWVKPAGLGAAVSWHQDGTTHWDKPDLDAGTHGFNFMAQLYPTTPENALWIVPGRHNEGKIPIRELVEANGSDELPEAVPLLCNAGDVAVCNRQMLHCSFPNKNGPLRATFVFGFHRKRSVLGVRGWRPGQGEVIYDEARIHQRSRAIAVAIDARQQQFPDETPYTYQPLAGEMSENRFGPATRESVLRNYNQLDLGI